MEEAILSPIDVFDVYPNILNEERLASLRKFLDAMTEKKKAIENLV